MKIITCLLSVISTTLIVASYPSAKAYASTSYTMDQVSVHNTSEDCWMSINGNVYDVTSYLTEHDSKLDIRPWCGKDATEDYADKNGRGQSHSTKADTLLSQYLIGTLSTKEQINPSTASPDSVTVSDNPSSLFGGYDIFLPLFLPLLAYMISQKFLQRQTHNFIWNSIMLLGLIPSFGFGMIMILAKQYAWLRNLIDSDILYNHVELSISFGVICILHFLYRLKIYISQGKISLKK